jgi:hypothetical protein
MPQRCYEVNTPMLSDGFRSPASDIVMAAEHPPYEDGGPCHDCAFRRGTEAHGTAHTVALAQLCVEGLTPFYCHVRPGLCRGFIAAANLRGVPTTEEERRHAEVSRECADLLADLIGMARAADEAVMTV